MAVTSTICWVGPRTRASWTAAWTGLVSFSDLNSSHWAFYPIMEASNSHDHIKAGGSEQWTGINN